MALCKSDQISLTLMSESPGGKERPAHSWWMDLTDRNVKLLLSSELNCSVGAHMKKVKMNPIKFETHSNGPFYLSANPLAIKRKKERGGILWLRKTHRETQHCRIPFFWFFFFSVFPVFAKTAKTIHPSLPLFHSKDTQPPPIMHLVEEATCLWSFAFYSLSPSSQAVDRETEGYISSY